MTPSTGPWHVGPSGFSTQILDAEDFPVAIVPVCSQQCEANCRLIAASPELLKIAERFFSFYELHKSARGGALGVQYQELRAKIMGEVKP